MRVQTLFFLALFFLLCMGGFAQSTSEKPPLIKLSSVVAFPSIQGFFGGQVSLSDFKDLAPNSPLLSRDNAGYTTADFSTASASAGISLMGTFAMRKGDGYLQHSELRLGVGFNATTSAFAERFSEERSPFDTLTSSQTGRQIFVDSVVYRSIRAENISNYLRLNVSWLLKTDPAKRFILYTGLGAYGALGIHSYTNIGYRQTGQTLTVDPAGKQLFGLDSEEARSTFESERYVNRNGFALGAYVPLGVELKIGETHPFWKRISVSSELRLGMDYAIVPDLGSNVRFFVQKGVGIKFSI